MSRDWQHLYSTAIDNPERLQSLPQHLNSSSLNHVFTYIAQEVAKRLQPSHHFPANRDSNPDEMIAKRCCEAQIARIEIDPEYKQIIMENK